MFQFPVLRLQFCDAARFRKELGHGETALELNVLLSEAVRMEEPNVSLAVPPQGMDGIPEEMDLTIQNRD